MRPVSDKASRDAWVMLACAVEDEPFKNRNQGRTMTSITKKNVHQNTSGHGYRPQETSRCTDLGKKFLGLTAKSTLGCTPAEYRAMKER